MKAKELIEGLKKFVLESEVIIMDSDIGELEVDNIVFEMRRNHADNKQYPIIILNGKE